jgi:hypothetical protein
VLAILEELDDIWMVTSAAHGDPSEWCFDEGLGQSEHHHVCTHRAVDSLELGNVQSCPLRELPHIL